MTRPSLREYAAVQRERYLAATRAEKGLLLDEVVAVTGLHRKAAIRLLRRCPRAPTARARAGRPRIYGWAVTHAAEVLWQATGHIGPQRLQPFVPELLDRLTRDGELALTPAVDKLVRQVSVATLGRLLGPARARRPTRGATTTRVGTWLRHEIPIRTFTEWDLCTVDIATAWVELEAVWGKGHERVGGGVHRVRQRLPMPLLGIDSDNGSEFINKRLYDYCQQTGVTFTRSRAWKKNDSAHVEQKNGAVVRQLIGYDRFASKAAYAQLARVYRLARLHVNFFQPVQKLVSKRREGARLHRVFDAAQTPYQRLCVSGVLSAEAHTQLETLYQRLNPLQLRRDLDAALDRLWALAAPDPLRPGPTDIASPTPNVPRPGSRPPTPVTLTSELIESGG